jgi:hypothetical protein
VIGRSQAEIHARFPGVVWRTLSTPEGAAGLTRLSEFEMEKFAELYLGASVGGPPLQGLIGRNAPAVLARYSQAVAVVEAQQQRSSGHVARHKAPNDFMTFDEIYAEFRLGSSAEAALYETARFSGGEITWAFAAGYTSGTVISYLMQNYCAACDNAVGATAAKLWDYAPKPEGTAYGEQYGLQGPSVQASEAGAGWGSDAYSSEGFGGGAPPPDGKIF